MLTAHKINHSKEGLTIFPPPINPFLGFFFLGGGGGGPNWKMNIFFLGHQKLQLRIFQSIKFNAFQYGQSC